MICTAREALGAHADGHKAFPTVLQSYDANVSASSERGVHVPPLAVLGQIWTQASLTGKQRHNTPEVTYYMPHGPAVS